MTYSECKDQVAIKAGFSDWFNLEHKLTTGVHEFDQLISIYYDRAAILYASQESDRRLKEYNENLKNSFGVQSCFSMKITDIVLFIERYHSSFKHHIVSDIKETQEAMLDDKARKLIGELKYE